MKKSKFLFIGLLSFGLAFASCSSDDDTAPPAGTCATPTDVILDNATSDAITLSWTSTGSAWTIEYGASGFTQGSGTQVQADANPFTINGLDASTDYDFYVRNKCSDGVSAYSSVANASTPSPLVGTWEAYDVSLLLASSGFTGISAKFNSNNTYRVNAVSDDADYVFEGSYTVSGPNGDGIYDITLSQSTPSAATSQGIFQVHTASPDSMWYEVAQIDPVIPNVTPPTPAGGFGSTSGGALGTMNIQKYHRQ